MNRVVWLLVLLLVVLHHDFWFWGDPRLVAGFLPIGMAWHIGISLGAAFTWLLAIKYCWPEHLTQIDPATGRPAKEGAAPE